MRKATLLQVSTTGCNQICDAHGNLGCYFLHGHVASLLTNEIVSSIEPMILESHWLVCGTTDPTISKLHKINAESVAKWNIFHSYLPKPAKNDSIRH